MNDYDFEKLAGKGISFDNLTARLQKFAKVLASAMMDVGDIKVLYRWEDLMPGQVLGMASPEDIAYGLESLRDSLDEPVEVGDTGSKISLWFGKVGDSFLGVVEWGPESINGIINRVEKAVREEIQDGALDEDAFDDAVENTIALMMDEVVAGDKDKSEFEAAIDSFANGVGQLLYDRCRETLHEAAVSAMEAVVRKDRNYSIPQFIADNTEEGDTAKTVFEKYKNAHEDLITAFFDDFESSDYYDLREFSETEIGRSWRDAVNDFENEAYNIGLDWLEDEIAEIVEK